MEYEMHRSDELTHWGIKGMRWGIRRYQNKDGSLTPAGEKRRARLEAELKSREKVIKNKERTKAKLEKLEAKKKELDERDEALENGKKRRGIAAKKSPNSETSGQKSVKDMTDDELREHTNRMQLESNYYNARKNLATANPRQVSKGQKFMEGLMNDVVVPAAKNVGKTYLENLLKDKLGLKEQPKLSIEDQVKKYNLERSKKGEKLADLQNEIAVLKAQESLRRLREEQKKDDDD